MKIYLFNPETGVYLGEDFADEALMKQDGYVIPPDATTIAPPEGRTGAHIGLRCCCAVLGSPFTFGQRKSER